jgi:hypothetical protein
MLGPLADNGGRTFTHAPLAGSPAIDAGDLAAVAGAGGVPLYDQRGTPFGRVANGDGSGGARIDIGAFEKEAPAGPALPGDYNLDGSVDAADYIVWRKSLGAPAVPPFSGADGDGDGTVDQDDLALWKTHFGQTLPGAGGGASAAMQPPQPVEHQPRAAPAEPANSSAIAELPVGHQPQTSALEPVDQAAKVEQATGARVSGSFPVSDPNPARQPRPSRPSLRVTIQPAATRRDDALLAWLASQPNIEPSHAFDELSTWNDNGERDSISDQLDSLDQAFTLVGQSQPDIWRAP